MNKVLKAKLRKLTMHYNSIDFLAETPGAEETDHGKIVTELERLFFDKDDPLSASDIITRLITGSENYVTQIAALEAFIAKVAAMFAMVKLIDKSLGVDWDAMADKATEKLNALIKPMCTVRSGTDHSAENHTHETLGPCFGSTTISELVLNRTLVESSDYSNPYGISKSAAYKAKLDTGVLFVQMHSDVTSPVKRGANLLESYMNYIPNIERSKCVPDVQVKFLTKQNVKAESNTEQLAVFNFLNGPGAPKPGSADLLFTKASKNDVPSGASDDRSTTTHGMEMFTMPQALRGHISDSNPLGDPFRPLMSLDDVSIDIYPAGEGFISYKKATLNFTLFDRTRLKDVSFLLDPSRYGSTIIEVDAGWTHPDNSSAYGAILNAMRIKDTYQITKADFSMKGSSTFNIKVDVAMLGGSGLFNKDVFSAGGSSHVKTMRALASDRRKLLSDYQTLQRALTGRGEHGGSLLPSSIVKRRGDNESALEISAENMAAITVGQQTLTDLIQRAGLSQSIDGPPSEELVILTEQMTQLDDMVAALTAPDNPIVQYENVSEQAVTVFKTHMERNTGNVDPFLSNAIAQDNKHISFGKLFFNLCVLPLIDSENVDDVHIIMYNFNKYAAAMGYAGSQSGDGEKHNLSTFALKQGDVIEKLTKHLKTKYFISPKDVMTYVRGVMSNRINEQYGIVTPGGELVGFRDERGTLQTELATARASLAALTSVPPTTGSDPNYFPLSSEPDIQNGTTYTERRTELTNSINEKTNTIDGLEEQISEGLATASENMMKEMGTSKIKMPDLKLYTETVKTKDDKTIIRLHVYDKHEAPYELHEIAANMGKIWGDFRLDASDQTENLFQQLDKQGLIIAVPPDEDRGTAAHHALNIRNLGLKKAIKNNMPSITYGTEATAINSISLSTISDSNVNTHFLLETRQKEKEDDEEDTSGAPEPEETIASAKDAQKIFPITMTIDMLGCPVIDYAQQMFIDLGTGTDLDNVYAAIDVTHKLKPGSFKTTVKMSPTFSGETVTFSDMIADIVAEHGRLKAQNKQ